jgi:hypothetical protein
MKDKENENATNDNINPQADTLTDLPVGGKQVEETKGGAGFNAASIQVLLGDGSAR